MAAAPPAVPVRLFLGLFALLLFAGCGDERPEILEVAVLHDSDEPAGPLQVTAHVRGGDAPVAVRLRVTARGPAALSGACGGPPDRSVWRNVDGGVLPEEGADCHLITLRRRGGAHVGSLSGPPYLPGTTLHYYLEAVDDDGDRAVWPPDAPASLASIEIAPPGRAPDLQALAPRAGPLAGGTEVLLKGAAFARDVEVWFGANRAATAEVVSGDLVVAVSPPGAAPGPVDVVVRRAGREGRLAGAFSYVRPPAIVRLTPGEGPTGEETLVVVEGEAFADGATVSFGELEPRPARWLAPDRLATAAPPHPPGAVDVVVTNPDGQQGRAPGGFRYWPPPVLEGLAPVRGPDGGGTVVTLSGRDLRAPGAVYLGVRPASDVQVGSDGRSATFVTPLQREGPVDVTFYNPDGQSATLTAAFRYLGPPSVTAAEPPVVSRCGGGLTTLVGRNFDPDMRVLFDGVEGEVVSVSEDATTAVVRAPPGQPGPVRLEVINPDGRAWRGDDLVLYGIQPVVHRVEPARVPVWGGTTVRIEGADFEAGAGVSFGDVPAERADVVRSGCDAVIEARVPPHEPGFVDLRVENPGGTAGTTPAAVEYVEPRLDPPHGLLPGYANLRLTGVDLRPGLRVRFGGVAPRAIERLSDEEWRLVTPAGPHGPVDVEVRNADGRGVVLPGAFRYRAFVAHRDRFREPGDCNDVEVVDLDGDGTLDVVAANGSIGGFGRIDQPVGLHLNDGRGRFAARELTPAGNGMNLSLGDYDRDGDPDLLVVNLSSPRNHLFRNEGGGRFVLDRDFPGGGRGGTYDGGFVDVDADGDLDVFLLQIGDPSDNATSGPERLLLNDGQGRFREESRGIPFDLRDVHDHDFAHGDLNGDGLPDLVIAVDNLSQGFSTARNRLLLNRGGGRFEEADSPFNQYPGDWLDVEILDLDGDGNLDVLLPQDYLEGFSRRGTPPLAVFLGDGRGGFREANGRIRGMAPVPAFDVVPADLDGDGDVDLAVAVYGILYGDGSVEPFQNVLLLNDGAAIFHEATSAFAELVLAPTADFGPGDFDGDGDLDLVECAGAGASLLWVQE